MIVEITPSPLRGSVSCPSSKSVVHRALIAAALSSSPTLLVGKLQGDDVSYTSSCLVSLGAKIEKTDFGAIVTPIRSPKEKATLYVGASGSTLRFLLSVSAALGTETTFSGTERLSARPIGELVETLQTSGVKFSSSTLPLTISGKLTEKNFVIDGSVSSQYVTGLLLALPSLGGGSVTVKNGMVSKNYLDITLSVMRSFGVKVEERGDVFTVQGKYRSPEKFVCESDWSSAGFFAVAGALGDVTITNLSRSSAQGDKAVLDALALFGAKITTEETAVRVEKNEKNPFVFDVQNCPDAAPILAVLAACADGKSTLKGTNRLKLKESDRSKEIVRMLAAFGIKATDNGDSIDVFGGKLRGGELVLPDDHRIAMASCVAATVAEGKTVLINAECVNKSYPDFYKDLALLGGKANVSVH